MPKCESYSSQLNNTYKKLATSLLNLFTEFNSQNETLITTLNDYSSDINTNKEAIVTVLDEYIVVRSECCYNLVVKIEEIITLFEQIQCIVPHENLPTTTEEVTTTLEVTTTPDPLLCNVPTEIDLKGVYYPYTVDKFLGAATGLVTVTFDAHDIPNRFVVIFDGVTVIDTGYVGDPVFQVYLDAACYLEGDTAGDITDVQSGTLYFNKDSAVDTCTIEIYSPLQNSDFQFTMSCPDDTAQCLEIVLEVLEIDFISATTTETPSDCAIYSITGEASGGVLVSGLLCEGTPYNVFLAMSETIETPCLIRGSLSTTDVTILELEVCGEATTTVEATTTELPTTTGEITTTSEATTTIVEATTTSEPTTTDLPTTTSEPTTTGV